MRKVQKDLCQTWDQSCPYSSAAGTVRQLSIARRLEWAPAVLRPAARLVLLMTALLALGNLHDSDHDMLAAGRRGHCICSDRSGRVRGRLYGSEYHHTRDLNRVNLGRTEFYA